MQGRQAYVARVPRYITILIRGAHRTNSAERCRVLHAACPYLSTLPYTDIIHENQYQRTTLWILIWAAIKCTKPA